MLNILRKFSRLAPKALCLLVLSGCATKMVAVGDWGRPSDLNLPQSALAGVRITVRCGALDHAGQITDRYFKLCLSLENTLKTLGAQLVPASEAGADFTLWYLDRGVSEKRGSALSFAAFCLSFGILPYVSSSASEAELRVTDSRGVILNQIPLRVEAVRGAGLGFLRRRVPPLHPKTVS